MLGRARASGAADFCSSLRTSQTCLTRSATSRSPQTDFALLNPNTRTLPTFRTQRDARSTKSIYRRVPVLIDESKDEAGNPWDISFRQGLFNMASDSRSILSPSLAQSACRSTKRKMIHQYDHRWARTRADAGSGQQGVLPQALSCR